MCLNPIFAVINHIFESPCHSEQGENFLGTSFHLCSVVKNIKALYMIKPGYLLGWER